MATLLTLAIEASNPSAAVEGESSCGVAVGVSDADGGSARVLGLESIRPVARHADDLMPAIDRLMRRLGLGPRSLGRVAVSVGPGGYTSLRVSIATAAMIAEATGASCIPVETDRVVAIGVEDSEPFAVVLASKRERAWVRHFGPDRQPTGDGAVIDAATFKSSCIAQGTRTVAGDRFVPSGFTAAASELGLRIVSPRLDPASCFWLSLAAPAVETKSLSPRYAREPEAVALWRARGG